MNLKEYAQMLDGRQSDIPLLQFTEEELQIARDNGYVIVYISSDCIEFDGALVDEDSVQPAVFFDRDGLSEWHEDEDKPNKIGIMRDEESWRQEGGIEWRFKTTIFHETFLIYEMQRIYCEGIVFSIDDLKKNYEEE